MINKNNHQISEEDFFPRTTEKQSLRIFWAKYPQLVCCSRTIVEICSLPLNHVTRIISDLKKENYLEIKYKNISPYSGRKVQMIGLKDRKDKE